MLYVSICRRPVIITNGSVIRTLAVLTFAPYPQQEARDSQNAAQGQPRTPRKRPQRRQQGSKRAGRRAQKGSKTGPRRPRRASGGPKREHPRIGPQPRPASSKNQAGSGPFWAPLWGLSWAPNRPTLTPERVHKRRQSLHAEKCPRRARRSARRDVRATPGEAKIIHNFWVWLYC